MPQVNDCWTETHPANPGLHASVVPDNGQLAGFHKVSSTPYGIHPIASDGAPSMFVSIIRSGTMATDCINRPNGPPANKHTNNFNHDKALARRTMPNAPAEYHVFGQVGGYTTG